MLTQAEREIAIEKLNHGTRVSRIARQLDKTSGEVRAIIAEASGEPERKVIAQKHVNRSWDNTDPEILAARQRYDAGMSEICTGRQGDDLILYEIPRIHPLPERVPYFSRQLGED